MHSEGNLGEQGMVAARPHVEQYGPAFPALHGTFSCYQQYIIQTSECQDTLFIARIQI